MSQTPFAAGWYLACFASDLPPGGVAPVEIAGVRLVAFRGASGEAAVLGRFCPHLGASLALGRVVGDTLSCPFHNWRFDTGGSCVAIPGAGKIPPGAKTKRYPTVERYAGVWVFLGADEPFYELPTEDELFGGEYFCARTEDLGVVSTTSRDILENAMDTSHVPLVHHVKVPEYEVTEWSPSRVVIEATVVTVGKLKSTSTTKLVGPGLWLNLVAGGLHRMPLCLFVLPSPVSATTTRLRCIVYVKGRRSLPWERAMAAAWAWLAMRGPHQDVALVWRDKVMHERPVLTAADGHIMKFRRWYADFEQRWRPAPTEPGA